jgi:hypothetical protein
MAFWGIDEMRVDRGLKERRHFDANEWGLLVNIKIFHNNFIIGTVPGTQLSKTRVCGCRLLGLRVQIRREV